MFSFFRKKKKVEEEQLPPAEQIEEIPEEESVEDIAVEPEDVMGATDSSEPVQEIENTETADTASYTLEVPDASEPFNAQEEVIETPPAPLPENNAAAPFETPEETAPSASAEDEAEPAPAVRKGWMQRLSSGLKRTGQGITDVFTGGTKIDDDLYEELETALLMADAGTAATQYLLEDVKKRVKETRATAPAAVRDLLAQSLEQLLKPLEASLMIGEHTPTVIMVAGVNGAGKTTSIGKLTRHLASSHHKVLLAAGDTFRAAAREQLEVWADRNQVEIVSQEGGDPASVSFDAVSSGKAKQTDVVIIDTAGRLATQPHLMEELKKIRRVIGKAMPDAPHEVLLVVDGNTGQNALAQVKAFDEAIQLTGLIVTKLDGTAKGGVIAAIALWSQEREKAGKPTVPIYFIGVGEQVEDLQTFSAKEFAEALFQE